MVKGKVYRPRLHLSQEKDKVSSRILSSSLSYKEDLAPFATSIHPNRDMFLTDLTSLRLILRRPISLRRALTIITVSLPHWEPTPPSRLQ